MRAIELSKPGGLDQLKCVNRETPQAGAGEILVNWRATSLNYHDYLVATGAIAVADKRIPMSDGAGVIVSVGDGVNHWQPGDNVMSLYFRDWQAGGPTDANTARLGGEQLDGFAVEMSTVPADAVTAMPSNLTYAQASTLPCAGLTAWRGLFVEGGLQAGDSVLVEGTGGMSILALQLAKATGAYVYATTSSDEKMDKLKALGADEVINYAADEKWGKTIYNLSDGGVDHVLDVGGATTMRHSIDAARTGGSIVVIGILGGVKGEILYPKLFVKQVNLRGISVGSADMQKKMVSAFNTTGITPVIDSSFNLERLADAFRHQESGSHFGKIVVEF